MTVNELAANFSVTRSAISQHLGVLAEVGLVVSRKEGRQRIYSGVPAGMAQLRTQLERFWTSELDLLVADATARTSDQLVGGNPFLEDGSSKFAVEVYELDTM